VAAGKFEMLIRLGITLEQGEVLGNLTNLAPVMEARICAI
jgi:predicted deacylase